jgi:asparagine synthase (glutamine-hydrolysing)
MCGIAGFAGTGTLADLRRMNAAQASRGPDAENTYHDPERAVFLGHLRLSIIDIAGGAQPMWTVDGSLGIVFNGEIYNHAELREELRALGAVFATDHSDTEVLLHAYRVWGDGFVERLNGMWAFVLYDRARRRLFASRDRFGKKPFYYTDRPGVFAFASELTALAAHPAVARTPSRTALRKYFAYGYIPAPHSYLEGVSKLPGGCNLEFDLERRVLRTWRYWEFRLEPASNVPRDPEREWGEQLLALLDRAVRRRLVSDVPIGTFLSGGIDSSAVSVLAARALGTARLQTFSIGFEEASFDESAYAQRVAELIGSEHHHRVFTEADAREGLPAVVARLDEPMGDSSLLPTSFLCRHARSRVTVALGGDGADELFAGYDPFIALRWAEIYQRWMPRPVHQAVALLAARLPVSHHNMSLDFRIKRTLRGLDYRPALWCPVWMASLAPADITDLMREPVDAEELYSEAIDAWDRCGPRDLASRVLEFYTRFYLQDDILAKVDRASMAHSLEVRAPFLDIELVDFVRKLPVEWKLRGGQTKALLKSALAPLLPAEILHRAKKGFGVPVGKWFRNGALPLPQSLPAGLDERVLKRKGESHRAGKSDERAFLWNAYLLSEGALSK